MTTNRMERLRIPLHRNRYTTRLPRRVVWLFGFLGACVLLGGWGTGAVILSRDTVSSAAPEHTQFVVHLGLNRGVYNSVIDRFGDFPLISNRSVRLSDLAPYIYGEISLFIESDGHRSVAIRTGKDGIPGEFLTAHALIEQQVGTSTLLLSDKLSAPGGWEPASTLVFPFSLPWHKRIGTLYSPLETSQASSGLYLSKQGIDVSLHDKWPENNDPLPTFPKGTFALLSTPVMTNVSVGTVTQAIDQLIPPNEGITSTAILSDVLTQPGQVILTKTDTGTGYLFTTHSPTWTTEARETLLKTVASVAVPQEKAWELPDNTRVMELIVEPSSITTEEITLSGTLVQRVATTHGFIYSAEKNGVSVLTNREELLTFWLDATTAETTEMNCRGTSLYLSLQDWLSTATSGPKDRTFTLVQSLSTVFPTISVENTFGGSTMHLCTH